MPGKVRVLIVDDHRSFREWVRSKLESSGQFEIVGEAADGYYAAAKAQEQNPDLVLLDIAMPELNGIETAELLRTAAPHARILFLSQISDLDVIRAALSDGARGFVLKSEAGSELLLAMEAVLRGEQFTSKRLDAPGRAFLTEQ